MTITYKDRFALIPKRCDKCNRLFWLEPYSVYYKEVGIEYYSLKQIKCKNHDEVLNPCIKCDYYHKENNTCQSKKCATGGEGYITLIDKVSCKPFQEVKNDYFSGNENRT